MSLQNKLKILVLLMIMISCYIPLTSHAATGCTSGNCQNGQGTYTYANGERYVGEWLNGVKTGQGTYTWTYEIATGHGMLTWTDGNRYVGEWLNDKITGQGTFTWTDGSIYVGEWLNDKRTGQGTFTWADGNRYVGEWLNDERTGQGTFTWTEGNIYVGGFFNGWTTQGVMSWQTDSEVCAPYIKAGDKYDGEWFNYKPNGSGTLTKANGDILTGTFVNCQITQSDTVSTPTSEEMNNLQGDSDKLFDWAEGQYSLFFPDKGQASQTLDVWYYRYYSSTNNYLGVNTIEKNVYVLGDTFGGQEVVNTLDALMADAGLTASTATSSRYLKLDNNGDVLADSASTWSCVYDTLMKVTWEVKTTDDGIRYGYNTHTWDDAFSYASSVNTLGLCGHSDWHVPTKDELNSLVYCSTGRSVPIDEYCNSDSSRPTIDTTFFPYTISSDYWSASPYSDYSDGAWYVNFNSGLLTYDNYKSNRRYVRLVRSGQ